MSTLRHYDDWGTARFITFSCNGRLPLLVSPDAKQVILHEIRETLKKYPIALFSYVIMPEHVHLVLFPKVSAPLGRVIGEIKSKSAIQLISSFKAVDSPLLEKLRVNRMNRAEYAFWLPRCYDHNCRSQATVLEKINYCHWNPVKRKLVAGPEDWIWSSYRYYVGEANGAIEVDPLV